VGGNQTEYGEKQRRLARGIPVAVFLLIT